MVRGKKTSVYFPNEEWIALNETCESLDTHRGTLIRQATVKYIEELDGSEELREEASAAVKVMQSKSSERLSGDFVGSFDKERQKIARIRKLVEDGDLEEEESDLLIERTRKDYRRTREAQAKLLKTGGTKSGIPHKKGGIQTGKKSGITTKALLNRIKAKIGMPVFMFLHCGGRWDRKAPHGTKTMTFDCPRCGKTLRSSDIHHTTLPEGFGGA